MDLFGVIIRIVSTLMLLRKNKMTTKKELIDYESEEKAIIRRKIAETINEEYRKDNTTACLDLFGGGESYEYFTTHTKARILSIDDNPIIGKRMKKLPGTRNISIADLCKEGREKLNIHFLDFCGVLGYKMIEDLMLLPKIMTEKGFLFITLRNGRETPFGKGTMREAVEIGLSGMIEKIFARNSIKMTKITAVKYTSFAKTEGERISKAGTSMKVYKFRWETIKDTALPIPYIENELLSVENL